MVKANYLTADEYHQAFGGETLARMQSIRKIIQEVARCNRKYQLSSAML